MDDLSRMSGEDLLTAYDDTDWNEHQFANSSAHVAHYRQLRVELIRRLSRSQEGVDVEGSRDALQLLYDETAEYIRINNLGDVHHNRAMQIARSALSSAPARPSHHNCYEAAREILYPDGKPLPGYGADDIKEVAEIINKHVSRIPVPTFGDPKPVDYSVIVEALEDTQLQIERMDASAEKIEGADGFISGYKFKTGAWHRLIGSVRGGLISQAITQARVSSAPLEGQMRIDISNLLAELDAHQQNTGELLEADDAAIVEEIRGRYKAIEAKGAGE